MIATTIPSEINTGILKTSISIILTPTNISTTARPYFNKENRSAMSASRKYIARRPRIAKTLDVSTMNGSVVIAKMAGIESTAKIRSVISTSTSTRNSGVA